MAGSVPVRRLLQRVDLGAAPGADGSWENAQLFQAVLPSSFGTDDDGEVYVTNYGEGAVYRLEGQ
jgi:hypothetical protein